MIERAQPALGLLLYPGLLWGLMLTLAMGRTANARLPGGGLRRGLLGTFTGRAPLALLLAALLPLAALALLPWPLSEQPLANPQHNLLLFWGLLEASFILALLPGLSAASAYAPRAAMREAQIGLSGRFVIWLAVGVVLVAGPWLEPRALPTRLLSLAAMLVALPAAATWGPFGSSEGTTPGRAEAGLSRPAVDLARWGRWARLTALIALIVVVSIPPVPPLIVGPYHLALLALVLVAMSVGLRALRGRLVGRSLPEALHFCWWRALPLALLGLLALLLP